MKRKWILISVIIAVVLAAGTIVKVNSLNTVADTEKLIIEDAPEEVNHEFVPNK